MKLTDNGYRNIEISTADMYTGRSGGMHDKGVSGYSDRTGTPDGIKEDIVF